MRTRALEDSLSIAKTADSHLELSLPGHLLDGELGLPVGHWQARHIQLKPNRLVAGLDFAWERDAKIRIAGGRWKMTGHLEPSTPGPHDRFLLHSPDFLGLFKRIRPVHPHRDNDLCRAILLEPGAIFFINEFG